MKKIGFSLQATYSKPLPDVIRLLKKTGFDAISPIWGPTTNLKEIASTAAECGQVTVILLLMISFTGNADQNVNKGVEDTNLFYALGLIVFHAFYKRR